MRTRIIVSLVFVSLFYSSSAQSAECQALNAHLDSVTGEVEGYLEELKQVGVLGQILTLSKPGCAPLTVTAGYTNINHTQKVTADHLFQVGSQTKMFTAAAILLLDNQGKLNLDDPVSRYIPQTPRPGEVTIKHLLLHTGGIGDSITFFDPPAGSRPDFEVSLENHLFLNKVAGEEFPPGTDWNYNNLGFVLLGEIVARVSEQSLDQFTRENLFEPLGMRDSYLGNLEDYPEAQMARGYFTDKQDKVVDTTMPELSWASSAGDMISSNADLQVWIRALLNPDNPTGLTLDTFITDSVLVSETEHLRRYGFGMMQRSMADQLMWGHGGFIHGYITLTLANPETGVVLQYMASLESDSEEIMGGLEQALGKAPGVFLNPS